jgi:hypothetical protein
MKLITEWREDDIKCVLVESEKGIPQHFIQGVFMQSNIPNKNGRMYPKNTMESQVNEYQNLIKSKRSLSELGHPATPQVNLHKASHLITELKMDGNNVVGKAKILDTPMGKIAKNLIDEGVQLGVSSRGLGSLTTQNGINIVQPDFILSAIDIVADPSGPNCFVEGIMEGKEWIFDATAKSWVIAEQIKSNIKKMTTKQITETKAAFFQMFLNGLK